MSVRFNPGTKAQLDKSNRAQWAQGAQVGWWAICTAAHDSEDACTLELYEEEAQAEARAAQISAGSPPPPPPTVKGTLVDIPPPRVQKLTTGLDALRGDGVTRGELDGLVLANVDAPIFGAGVFTGFYRGDAVVRHSIANAVSTFQLEFLHGGTKHTVKTTEDFVRSNVQGDKPVPIDMSEYCSLSPELLDILKKLPASASIDNPTQVCAKEMSILAKKTGIVKNETVYDWSSQKDLDSIASCIGYGLPIIYSRFPSGVAPPTSSPAELGAALIMPPPRPGQNPPPPASSSSSSSSSGGSSNGNSSGSSSSIISIDLCKIDLTTIPDSHAATRAMARLAAGEGEWKRFLARSVELTTKAQSRDFTLGSTNAMSGALNRWLNKRGGSVAIGSIAAAGSLDYNGLMGAMAELEQQEGMEVDESTNGGISSFNTAAEPKIWSELATPASVTDQNERRQQQVLRSDYEKMHSKEGLEQLAKLEKMHEQKDIKGLVSELNGMKNVHLERLINAPGDVDKALQGACNQSRVNTIINVRNALDRRVEKYIWGDKEPPSDSAQKVVQKIRTGQLSHIRWFNVIGKDDNGTNDDPLKQLSKESEPGSLLSAAVNKVSGIAQVASPQQAAEISLFFMRLEEKLRGYRAEGAEWSAISKYLSAVLRRCSKNVRSYSFGESTDSGASYDLSVFEDNSEYRDAMQTHISKVTAWASAKKQQEESSGGGKSGQQLDRMRKRLEQLEQAARKPGDKGPRSGPSDLVKTKEPKIKDQKKRPNDDDKDDDDEKPKRPAGGSDEMKEWNDANLIKGKPRCWDDGHGGCSKGAKCRFPHKEE